MPRGGTPGVWPGGRPYDPPGRRSGAGVVVAVVVVGLLLVGVAVTGVIGSRLTRTTTAAEPGYEGYRPGTSRPQLPPAPTSAVATSSAGERTTAAAESSQPSQPSPPPQPQRRPVQRLGDHPINQEGLGLPAVSCELPRFGAAAAAQDRFYRAGVPCLDSAWAPVLAAAGLPFSPPGVETITGTATTPCGNQPADRTAFYCPDNDVIYMTALFYAPRYGDRAGGYLAVLAHEYGHHVQGVSGIFDAYWAQRYEAGPDTPLGLELSRRLELQATCFAGMFATGSAGRGSVTATMTEELLFALGNGGADTAPGLPRDHGTMASNSRWAEQGRRHNRAWQCNTWRADADTVG
ncbi:MAG TPA: neutral zinc metallopeptidase [Micromonospora sp.]